MKLFQQAKRWWAEVTAVQAETPGCPHCSHASFFVIDAASGLRKCARCGKPSYPARFETPSSMDRLVDEIESQPFVRRLTVRGRDAI